MSIFNTVQNNTGNECDWVHVVLMAFNEAVSRENWVNFSGAVLRLCIELISSVQRAFGGCLGAKRR